MMRGDSAGLMEANGRCVLPCTRQMMTRPHLKLALYLVLLALCLVLALWSDRLTSNWLNRWMVPFSNSSSPPRRRWIAT